MSWTRWHFRAARTLGATLALLVGGMVSSGAAHAQTRVAYVALGDSYTSGPLIPNQHGNPIDCGRSDHNYPSLVAQALGVSAFVDVSCGSAQTRDMTAPQTGLPLGGTNPPQFNALGPDTSLVSVGIGGNDAGLVGVGETCAKLGATAPTGTACRDHYAPHGQDTVAAKIEQTKAKIAAVLQGIHQRSPLARVAIVGYPDVLPKNGGSCYPMVPLSPDDVRYIDELIVRINAMIAGQAAANNAEFIDTYADSGGHDVCTLPPTRWFEGLVPTQPAYPLHPNGQGEASMARSAIAVLSRPRPLVLSRPWPTAVTPNALTPVLSKLRVSPRRIPLGRAATISYRLDRAARVTVTVQRAISGRRSGARCAPLTRRNRHGRRCTRYSGATLRMKLPGKAGANHFKLRARRLGRRMGRDRVTATPTADGLGGVPAVSYFRIVPRRP